MTTLQTVQKLARQHGYSVRKLDPPSGMPPDFAREFADKYWLRCDSGGGIFPLGLGELKKFLTGDRIDAVKPLLKKFAAAGKEISEMLTDGLVLDENYTIDMAFIDALFSWEAFQNSFLIPSPQKELLESLIEEYHDLGNALAEEIGMDEV